MPCLCFERITTRNEEDNKWDPRARLGIYIGNSPRHARSVSLILNLSTGHVSLQYHVQHDEFFETVKETDTRANLSRWKRLAGFNDTTARPRYKESMPNPQDSFILNRPNVDSDPKTLSTQLGDSPPVEQTTTTPRRSNRTRKMTEKMKESIDQGLFAKSSTTRQSDEEYFEIMHDMDYDIQMKLDNPIAYLAKTDKDTMYLQQALQEPDREQFVAAVIKEMNDHISRDHWKLIPVTQVSENQKVLDAVWSMKRKRHLLTGEIYKWKARLNIHGG